MGAHVSSRCCNAVGCIPRDTPDMQDTEVFHRYHRRHDPEGNASKPRPVLVRAQTEQTSKSPRMKLSVLMTSDEEDDDEENEILSTQYELLSQQNSLFIGKHATYFQETYQGHSKGNEHRHKQSDRGSFDSNDSRSTLCTNHSAVGSMSPMSPLSGLSGNHANIILAYSDSFPTKPRRGRSFSLPGPATASTTTAFGGFHPERITAQLSQPGGYHGGYSMSTGAPCESIDTCRAVVRVAEALECYSKADNGADFSAMVDNINNRFLLCDYQHILSKHLQQKYEINMGMEYEMMTKFMHKRIPACDIKCCQGHARYHAAKRRAPNHATFHDSFLKFMDSLHCFIMHSQDL